jgi:cystathionine beta-lyase
MRYNFDEVIQRDNTDCFKYDLRNMFFRTSDVIPMWVADMDFKSPPCVIDALRKRLDHEILGYTYLSKGILDSVVTWNKARHRWDIKPEWISFSPGVVPALNLLVLAFTEPGDHIIVQPPVYFPFFSAVTNHGRELVYNQLLLENGTYTIDFDGLQNCLEKKPKMMFFCSPHNPGGNVWAPDVLQRIGQFCLENDILLISDEIHSDMVYSGFRHTPMASLSPEIADNTITAMSPSKTFNLAGLSTAYLVIPDPQKRARYEEVLDHIHVGAGNLFGYIAMQAAYTQGEDWLNQLMDYLENNLNLMNEYIEKHIPSIRVIQPQATYLVWLDCSALGMQPAELKEFMIREAGLGLNDGPMFGPGGTGFQRINIACPRTMLLSGLQKLEMAIKKYLGN